MENRKAGRKGVGGLFLLASLESRHAPGSEVQHGLDPGDDRLLEMQIYHYVDEVGQDSLECRERSEHLQRLGFDPRTKALKSRAVDAHVLSIRLVPGDTVELTPSRNTLLLTSTMLTVFLRNGLLTPFAATPPSGIGSHCIAVLG